jgi:hypothetical protein
MKKQRSHYENGVDKENGTQKQGEENRVEPCTNRVCVQQNLIVSLWISK